MPFIILALFIGLETWGILRVMERFGGGFVLLWLLGAFAGLAIIRQLGAVSMLVAAALALLGPRVGAGLEIQQRE